MTCLEHLVENCLENFKKGKSPEDIREEIKKDINYEYAGITAEQCYEICQYVWWTFIFCLKQDWESRLGDTKNE